MNRFAWARPTSLASAAATAGTTVADAMTARQRDGAPGPAVLQAGGIDVLDLMKEEVLVPGLVVSLRAVPDLDRIVEEAAELRIGAGATLATVAAHPVIQTKFPALAACLGQSASPQIRAMATLGGNLLQRPRCWYFRSSAVHCLRKGGGHCFAIRGESQYHAVFDNDVCAIVHPSSAATVLVALGASVELVSADGTPRRLLLEDFFVAPEQDVQRENDLQPHEILTAILLPASAVAMRTAYLRLGEKQAFDWPLVDAAVALELDNAGICRRASIRLGAVAPVPHRPRAAEAALVGNAVDATAAQNAAHAALDGATPLAGNKYKLSLIEAILGRAILKAAHPA